VHLGRGTPSFTRWPCGPPGGAEWGRGSGSPSRPSRLREMDAMAGNALQHLGDVEEIRIGFQRPDGSTGSTPVWVVRTGDDTFVRSMYGMRGGWYQRLRANRPRPGATHPGVRGAGHGCGHRGGGHACLGDQVRRQLVRAVAAEQQGSRRNPAAGAPTLVLRLGAALKASRRWVGTVLACDLPERPGTTTLAGCTPWRRGSWARPSNRPQATQHPSCPHRRQGDAGDLWTGPVGAWRPG
jgi:hypothetical protein